jgi:hypothetical protein
MPFRPRAVSMLHRGRAWSQEVPVLTEEFELAAGTVTGKDHLHSRRPNQDAFHVLRRPGWLAAIVCDGCGDPNCPHSGVGAQLGARWMTAALAACWEQEADPASLLERTRGRVLAVMERLARSMALEEAPSGARAAPAWARVVRDYLLFTVVGVVVTPAWTAFFSIGDGTLIVNGETIRLGPFPGNAPPYLAYSLLDSSLVTVNPELLHFQIHRCLPTSELDSFLIGSDGALEIDAKAEVRLPKRGQAAGPLSQFWDQDAYFANPEAVNRKLALMNTDSHAVDWEARRMQKFGGLLSDDTTLVAGRRKRS